MQAYELLKGILNFFKNKKDIMYIQNFNVFINSKVKIYLKNIL